MKNNSPKILVVEDERLIAKLWQEALVSENIDCTLAYNGEQAISALENNSFDLVITDLVMPIMTGEALIDYIFDQNIDIPIAVCSGNIDCEESISKYKEKVLWTFKKPVDVLASARQIVNSSLFKNS